MSFLGAAAVQRSFIMQDNPNHVHSMADAGLDDATLEFAHQVFNLARSGESDELARLLGQGLPPNLRNDKGDSLLMLASYHGHLDAVKVLLDHNADPDLRNLNGQTPIAGAAFKGNLPMIELLLEHGADVEGSSPDGRTALMIAAMFNRTEIVEYLVARGANVSAKDANGVDAVQAAKLMGAQNTSARLEELQRGDRPAAD
jgi:ankyrin repeat protein